MTAKGDNLGSQNTNGLANPGALGLGGFALSTFILNIVNAGLVDAATLGLAVFFFFRLAGVQAFVDVPPAGIAVVLIAWGIFTGYATIASLRRPKAVTWVFISLTILFILLAIGEFNPIVHTIAGYEGILCSLIAWYASAGILINSVHGRTVLPLGERK